MEGKKTATGMLFTLDPEEVIDAPFYVKDGERVLAWKEFKIGEAIINYVMVQLKEKHRELYQTVDSSSIGFANGKFYVRSRSKRDVKD